MAGQKTQLAIAAVIIIVCGGGALLLFGNGFNLGNGDVVTLTLEGDKGIDTVTGDGNYYADSNITVTATVNDGYTFEGWYDEDGNKLSSSSTYSFKIEKNTTLKAKSISGTHADVYAMHGISDVLITSKDENAKTVTLKPILDAGVTFTGWYSFSGTLVSSNQTLTISEQYLNSIVAKTNSTEYNGIETFNYSLNYEMDEDTVIWIITDWRTGEFVESFTKTSSISTTIHPGKYDLRVVGTRTNGKYLDKTQQEVITGTVEKTFRWTFEGKSYGAVWTTDYTYYNNYQNSSVNRAPTTYNARMKFIDDTSTTVSSFAEYLNGQSEGMTELQRANFVLAFVQQCIEYQLDSDFCDKSEYWKYPYETLYDGRGDCEDSTILYCSIMKSMGYKSAMILYLGEEYIGRGHAAAGVAIEGGVSGGTYYEKDGVRYFFCETTGSGYKVGTKISGYNTAYVYVV